jgi:hypothetical protein
MTTELSGKRNTISIRATGMMETVPTWWGRELDKGLGVRPQPGVDPGIRERGSPVPDHVLRPRMLMQSQRRQDFDSSFELD